jgi:hypothetical protein
MVHSVNRPLVLLTLYRGGQLELSKTFKIGDTKYHN